MKSHFQICLDPELVLDLWCKPLFCLYFPCKTKYIYKLAQNKNTFQASYSAKNLLLEYVAIVVGSAQSSSLRTFWIFDEQ